MESDHSQRRYDLDWLRIIAFGLLIYFHAAIIFIPGGIPMIQNDETSTSLTAFVAFLQEFRLALLFLVSGAGVCLACRRRTPREFLRERTRRLGKPFLFGIVFLVPPTVYLEKRWTGTFEGDLGAFYGRLLFDGIYPVGHLSWHHFWFLAYLYLFCLIALPAFRLIRERRPVVTLWLQQHPRIRRHVVYLPVVPLATLEVGLRWAFPGFRDLVHDWASFSVWLLVFTTGYVMAAAPALLDEARACRRGSLAIALLASSLLFTFFWPVDSGSFTPIVRTPDGQLRVSLQGYLTFCVLRAVNLWSWLLVIVGYAGNYLNRPGRWVRYLNGAVFPLFCVHLPLIVALGYLIAPMALGLWAKFALVTTLATLLSLLTYEVLVRPWKRFGVWLGGRGGESLCWAIRHSAGRRSRGRSDHARSAPGTRENR